ncbi:MAG: serine O-acetyltransferase EpsC [Clostridia bacterium]|nr:serine O-acetyltransferase EpsC [Clostridia bacterium]
MSARDRAGEPASSRIVAVAAELNAIGERSSGVLCCRAGIKRQTVRMTELLRSAMYPQVFGVQAGDVSIITVSHHLKRAMDLLGALLATVLEPSRAAEAVAREFLAGLPAVKRSLETDIRAAYCGDPAAKSAEEIMLAYPAFEAISIFRLAHAMYELDVPILPRIMTEHAHAMTGIDIHPGARIGESFFIDHGTGVVVGETCVIGSRVKLYQGVTLGARSFELDADGNPIKGTRRHPRIGDDVVIYAGATILGGDTVIGDKCVIGGNVWLTHSVAAGKTVVAAEERAHCRIF